MLNRKITLPLILLFISFLVPKFGVAEDFNGVISFWKIDGADTTLYKYYVKGNRVRIEDIKKNGEVNGIMLINLDNSIINVLSGSKKIYIDVPVSNKKADDLDVKYKKSKEKKLVANKECKLWQAQDKISENKFDFWVNDETYSFFNKMLLILNREELLSHVWLKMEIKGDYFPLIGIEYDVNGEILTKLEVFLIENKDFPDELFVIPADYQLLEKQPGF